MSSASIQLAGPDFHRWPATREGHSFYWEGLNRAKRSVTLDISSPEGRELLQQLATASGDNRGLLITNFPASGFLSHDRLKALRDDLITVRVMGKANGEPALDYTVNCELGIPQITGPAQLGDAPVNHILPAWDLLTGSYAAFSLLAAERHRRLSGDDQEVRIPLADIGIASIANLGMIAEALHSGASRARFGNEVFGAFGRDFVTADGQRLMIMAMTKRQWSGLVGSLKIEREIEAVESEHGLSFDEDEGLRFEHRAVLFPLIESRVAARYSGELSETFDRLGVCWSRYRSTLEAAATPGLVPDNPIFEPVRNPSGFTYPSPGAPMSLPGRDRLPVQTAPLLGADTEAVLSSRLGMSSGQIASLIDRGVAGVPSKS